MSRQWTVCRTPGCAAVVPKHTREHLCAGCRRRRLRCVEQGLRALERRVQALESPTEQDALRHVCAVCQAGGRPFYHMLTLVDAGGYEVQGIGLPELLLCSKCVSSCRQRQYVPPQYVPGPLTPNQAIELARHRLRRLTLGEVWSPGTAAANIDSVLDSCRDAHMADLEPDAEGECSQCGGTTYARGFCPACAEHPGEEPGDTE